MKKPSRLLALIIAFLMSTLIFSACSENKPNPSPPATATPAVSQTPVALPESSPTPAAEKPHVKVAILKGPTGIGMAKLMEENKADKAQNNYAFELSGSPDEIVGKLTSGSIDIAAVPTNLAAVLYNKTSGNIKIVAINTLGVLYVIENGDTIKSVADLKGKTIAVTGQGATPEYALNYILEQNKLVPGKDITVKYLTEHSELATLLVAGKETVAMLPEPFVTTVLTKNTELRKALDITTEWETANEKAGNSGSELVMGCIVVRKEFAEKSKDALDNFLVEYKASTEYTNSNIDETAQIVADQGILADVELTKKAIPNCNIVYIDGNDMKKSTQTYLDILMKANPKSIGGKIPNEDFYYTR